MDDKDRYKWAKYFAESTNMYAAAAQTATVVLLTIVYEMTKTPPEDASNPEQGDLRYESMSKCVDRLAKQLSKAREAAIEARTLWEEEEKGGDK